MRNYSNYSKLFDDTNTEKQWVIDVYRDNSKVATFTNEELRASGVILTESICEQSELRFVGCIASELRFTISSSAFIDSLKGLKVKVYIKLGGDTGEGMYLGEYFVDSDQVAADSTNREVCCYDKLAWLLDTNVDEWYKGLFENASSVTLGNMRNSLWMYLGYAQESTTLVNDSLLIEKTLDGTGLSASTVLKSICELNGVCGQIRQGVFCYVKLTRSEELYPADDLFPADDLYPKGEGNTRYMSELDDNALYLGGSFESFEAKAIDGVTIREEDGDAGVVVGDSNSYIIQGNFLCYGKGTEELAPVARNILDMIKGLNYSPYNLYAQANLCFEAGDTIVVQTRNGVYQSFILTRTCKGGQYIRDEYRAEGKEEQEVNEYSVSERMYKLQSKSNVLERTIEQTQSTIIDTARGLQSQITQNAEEIEARVTYGEYTASIIVSKINNGSVSIKANKINFDGFTTFARTTDLTNGITTIDGACIKTGTISADRIDTDSIHLNALYDDSTGIATIENIEGTVYIGGASGYGKISIGGYSVKIEGRKVGWTKLQYISDDTYVLCEEDGGVE